MLWILRTGSTWRDLPDRDGKWISVYQRFRRWAEQGVWDALPEAPVELGLTDDWMHMIDTASVRAHSQAAGAEGGLMRTLLVEAAETLGDVPTAASIMPASAPLIRISNSNSTASEPRAVASSEPRRCPAGRMKAGRTVRNGGVEMGTGPEGPVSVARLSRAPFGHAVRRTARMSTLSLAVVILDIRT